MNFLIEITDKYIYQVALLFPSSCKLKADLIALANDNRECLEVAKKFLARKFQFFFLARK